MIYRILSLAFLTSVFALNAQAQTLAEQVEEFKSGWLFGTWTGTTDDGDALETSFKWELDKHIIVTESTNPSWKTKAITAIDPASGEVGLIGYSSLGGAMKGEWDVVNGNPVLKLKITTKDRDDMNIAIRYSKVDGTTMKVEILKLEDGDLVEPADWSTHFKKK